MKQIRLITVLVLICICAACAKSAPSHDDSAESMWDLGKRYDATYSKTGYSKHFAKGETAFYLAVTRSKDSIDNLKNIKETKTIGSCDYALCESVAIGSEQPKESCAYYVCMDGNYRYILSTAETSIDISQVLTFEEAACMMPEAKALPDGVTFLYEEWDGYYRLESCNLEVYVYPSDNGSNMNRATTEYEQRVENGETYLYSEMDLAILYTDGVNTVWIRQSNRAGTNGASYSTLSECKAILALIGS